MIGRLFTEQPPAGAAVPVICSAWTENAVANRDAVSAMTPVERRTGLTLEQLRNEQAEQRARVLARHQERAMRDHRRDEAA